MSMLLPTRWVADLRVARRLLLRRVLGQIGEDDLVERLLRDEVLAKGRLGRRAALRLPEVLGLLVARFLADDHGRTRDDDALGGRAIRLRGTGATGADRRRRCRTRGRTTPDRRRRCRRRRRGRGLRDDR